MKKEEIIHSIPQKYKEKAFNCLNKEPDHVIRTSDSVYHLPSKEAWTVAWADKEELIPCGWPEGFARVKDCIVFEIASDEDYWKLVNEIANSTSDTFSYKKARCTSILEDRLQKECITIMHL